jgi:two-component system, NarL family, response regulator NreC
MSLPRVLLVDDHRMFLEGLCSILSRHFEVVGTAANGEEALAAARQLQPDVIVMDLSMPVLNGMEATRKLREMNTRSKIILVTMYTDPAFASEALDAGASGYVLKSDAGAELVAAIREVLQGKRTFPIARHWEREARKE